jgi:hypothetical protein
MINFIFIQIILFFSIPNTWAGISPEERVKNFDIRSYAPQKQGMKDLSVVVRINGLQEMLNKAGNLGKINNLYFTLHWSFPDKVKIVANGLSPKMHELQAALSAQIFSQISLIIPQDLEKTLKGMKVKIDKDSEDENTIVAFDETGKMANNQINIFFDKLGVLASMQSFGLMGTEKSNYDYKVFPWSNNKYALSTLSVERPINGGSLKSTTNINYFNKDGYGVPEKIIIATESVSSTKTSKLNQVELIFSNYRINTGEASKEILKGNIGNNE